MIYTITFNPSLDYVVHTTDFSTGNINRAEAEAIYPGGKGPWEPEARPWAL